jgi:hypothetical protein
MSKFLIIFFHTILLCFLAFAQTTDDSLIILNDNVKNINFLSDIEKSVLTEINKARTNPKEYATKLKEYRKFYSGKYVEIPGKTKQITNEGILACDEAIDYLENVKSLPPLKISSGLSKAAKLMVNDQGTKGNIGHNGSNGSSPFDRMNLFGSWQNIAGENISYGKSTAEEIVFQLLIDDGVSGRGHRINIFNREYTITGIGFGVHKKFNYMCVIDFAGGYTEK